MARRLAGGVEDESRMLMCVFKGENGELVITISTATVIRRVLLPERVGKSCCYWGNVGRKLNLFVSA